MGPGASDLPDGHSRDGTGDGRPRPSTWDGPAMGRRGLQIRLRLGYPVAMVGLRVITHRSQPPRPWSEGDNIPWNEPGFSRRMLAEHFSQEHNLASRQFPIIDRQVDWIHREVLGACPTRILDLACGPGFYTSRLARLGHTCVGIDFSPAAIHHAREEASREQLDCVYGLEDLRTAEFGHGFGLVMMLFGQLNVFQRDEARAILAQAMAALAPGGLLLLEVQRFQTVQGTGQAGNTWYTCGDGGGLFSARPHLTLVENAWDPEVHSATQRFFIVDADSGQVECHALSVEAYTDTQYRGLLAGAGCREVLFFPSLVGTVVEETSQAANLVLVGRS